MCGGGGEGMKGERNEKLMDENSVRQKKNEGR